MTITGLLHVGSVWKQFDFQNGYLRVCCKCQMFCGFFFWYGCTAWWVVWLDCHLSFVSHVFLDILCNSGICIFCALFCSSLNECLWPHHCKYVAVCVRVCLTEKKKEREMTGLWSADLFSNFFSAIRYLVLCVSVFFLFNWSALLY